MLKLNQIIAIEKGVKSKSYSELTQANKLLQKNDIFNGFNRSYRKIDDEGEEYPNENKIVQANVNDIVKDISKELIELFDITFTKDIGNTKAFADIKVNGEVLIKNAPSTFILFLEKQLNDIKTFIENIPVLDVSENWKKDESSNLYKSDMIITHKSKKIIKPITLAEATDKHPAQAQLINDDVLVGYWDTNKLSGAMKIQDKKELIDRVDKLIISVKMAREEANSTEIEKYQVSEKIFTYLFK